MPWSWWWRATSRVARTPTPDDSRCPVAVRPPSAAHPRISLTLPAILDARRLALHITGADKWEVYRWALGEGPAEEQPEAPAARTLLSVISASSLSPSFM